MSFHMATIADAGWLLLGAMIGIGGMLARRKLADWRESRLAADWDPY